jgi:hypothetical protein
MLTAHCDRFGSVSLATDTAGRVYRWYRDGEALTATHAPILRDLRSDKGFRYHPATESEIAVTGAWELSATRRTATAVGSALTFPFTGVGVAVVADCHQSQ